MFLLVADNHSKIPNQYLAKVFVAKAHGISKYGDTIVTLLNHSSDFKESDPPRKRQRMNIPDFALPDPQYIRIHYAIAAILHQSKVGEQIDQLNAAGGRGAAA